MFKMVCLGIIGFFWFCCGCMIMWLVMGFMFLCWFFNNIIMEVSYLKFFYLKDKLIYG